MKDDSNQENYNSPLSDETLNSLVDNEFPVYERAKLLAYLQTDEVSKDKACQVSYLKDMVKTAYSDIPEPVVHKTRNQFSVRSWYSLAASILLGILFIGGAFFGLQYESKTPQAQRMVILDPEGRGQVLSQNETDELRVVFHVSNSTRLNADELLDDIEGLLQQSIREKQKVRVEVVAHAEGLDLLRERLSIEKERIASMSLQYPELTFVACLNTVERLRTEKGIIVKLIPDAVSTQSGVAHVVKRQQQGWLYIQV